jgi:hypothetical protein
MSQDIADPVSTGGFWPPEQRQPHISETLITPTPDTVLADAKGVYDRLDSRSTPSPDIFVARPYEGITLVATCFDLIDGWHFGTAYASFGPGRHDEPGMLTAIGVDVTDPNSDYGSVNLAYVDVSGCPEEFPEAFSGLTHKDQVMLAYAMNVLAKKTSQ